MNEHILANLEFKLMCFQTMFYFRLNHLIYVP